jgi:UDP-N-acetylmuramate dehydrogenase
MACWRTSCVPRDADTRLSGHNTLALEARARAILRAERADEVADALAWARARGLSLLPLGEGSNVVFAGDLDAAALLLQTRGRERLAERGDSVSLRVQAGENWHELVAWTLDQGLYGLENLALIPGKVGAAPIQNIGAYGVELAEVLEAVHGLELATGRAFSLTAAECQLGYRDSVFKHALRDTSVITAVDLRLSRRAAPRWHYPSLAAELAARGIAQPSPGQVFDAVVAIRRSRLPDPALEPNAGSFFKNPVLPEDAAQALLADYPALPHFPAAEGRIKLPAAWLIEQCGWKGQRQGGVGVHPGHALVLVNYGGNDGAALLALAEAIRASVAARFGVELEIEPRVYGGA